eukprot:TRINITY_DN2445_c0_g2_i1.p1 TRINITY_DN2445_c0_g2~~TRINITY_DN2445_c0_g2_i1.p1  ORF type:complete len:182 (+),score=19.25 TRINITY_DN2445_c0_g2_i1:711-1256(+)
MYMRPSVMLGPGDVRFRSTKMILSYLDGRIPVIPPGGYSFVDVRDVAQAFQSAMVKGNPGESYLLASSCPSIDGFFTMLSTVSGVTKPKIKLPPQLFIPSVIFIDWVNRKIRRKWNESFDPVKAEMGIHFWNISSTRAKEVLSWTTMDPMQTLKDTVDWIEKNRLMYNCPEPPKFRFRAKL